MRRVAARDQGLVTGLHYRFLFHVFIDLPCQGLISPDRVAFDVFECRQSRSERICVSVRIRDELGQKVIQFGPAAAGDPHERGMEDAGEDLSACGLAETGAAAPAEVVQRDLEVPALHKPPGDSGHFIRNGHVLWKHRDHFLLCFCPFSAADIAFKFFPCRSDIIDACSIRCLFPRLRYENIRVTGDNLRALELSRIQPPLHQHSDVTRFHVAGYAVRVSQSVIERVIYQIHCLFIQFPAGVELLSAFLQKFPGDCPGVSGFSGSVSLDQNIERQYGRRIKVRVLVSKSRNAPESPGMFPNHSRESSVFHGMRQNDGGVGQHPLGSIASCRYFADSDIRMSGVNDA